jgi:hypothetical protein
MKSADQESKVSEGIRDGKTGIREVKEKCPEP